jgi:hypothetical protein
MPVVLVPAPSSVTAKPAARAKLPPLVIGRTISTFVTRLNASGDMIKTGRRPCRSCPCAGSRPNRVAHRSPRSESIFPPRSSAKGAMMANAASSIWIARPPTHGGLPDEACNLHCSSMLLRLQHRRRRHTSLKTCGMRMIRGTPDACGYATMTTGPWQAVGTSPRLDPGSLGHGDVSQSKAVDRFSG